MEKLHEESVCEIVQRICPTWGEASFQVIEMKRFMQRNLYTEIDSLFAVRTSPLSVRCVQGLETWSCAFAVTRLLRACKTYFHVLWLNPPSEQEWLDLLGSRNDILSVFDALKWPLTPTIHYMTDHLFTLHKDDRNFFPWLQEGAEHHHQSDQKSAKNLFHGGGSIQGRQSMSVQILEEQELRRILRARGHDL